MNFGTHKIISLIENSALFLFRWNDKITVYC